MSERYRKGERAYVAGYPTDAPDVPVRIMADDDGTEVIVKFSKHDHGRDIPRGAVHTVSLFYMLPASMVEGDS